CSSTDGRARASRGQQALEAARQAARDLVTAAAEDVLVLHRGVGDVARLAGELAHGEDGLARRLREVAQHLALLPGHDQDDVRLGEEVALALQVGCPGAGRQLDADLAQHEARVERDQAAVTRVGRDTARADLDASGEAAVLGEQPLEHLLRDDAAARVGVADDEDAPPGRRACAHSPPAKTSAMPSGAVMPFASSSLMRAPSFIGSQGAGSGFFKRAAECQPFIGHTLRPPTRNTCPFTPAASSLTSQATSGATLAGLNMSNSPGLGSAPMRAAVEGVASTVSRVRATGAIALAVTPYFFISWPMMIAMAATAALHAP